MIDKTTEHCASMPDISSYLDRISSKIGSSVSILGFEVCLSSPGPRLGMRDFNLHVRSSSEESTVFAGHWRDISLEWEFTSRGGGQCVSLHLQSEKELGCASVNSLLLRYAPENLDRQRWRVMQSSADYVFNPIGFPTVEEALAIDSPTTMLAGLFDGNQTPGLFLGTIIPQNHVHHYSLAVAEGAGVRYTTTTYFIDAVSRGCALSSEVTWACATMPAGGAYEIWCSFVPPMPVTVTPLKGWNSWDYYYFTVSSANVEENMDVIRNDPALRESIKYVMVDEGWEHMPGEWEPNYKFPGGLSVLAGRIKAKGFVPGIWTAPILLDQMSYPGWRMPEIIVKNGYGDPLPCGKNYLLDPTAPAGREFLRQLYTRLYEAGFRLFKVDFVGDLLQAQNFYDRSKGPYEAIRELFAIIRSCVTDESHILGCSLPVECGPGVVNSGRTGIDIHNQWNHLEWAVECFTFQSGLNRRVWINDADFVVVRGDGTSLEEETNVLNPSKNNPDPKGFQKRWRRGPVFNVVEARTWASFVLSTGGNVFLSDRLAMLNELGLDMARRTLEASPAPARPLDLCCGFHAAFWLQQLVGACRLTIINWSGERWDGGFSFEGYGLPAPLQARDWWTGQALEVTGGLLCFSLEPHGCLVAEWLC